MAKRRKHLFFKMSVIIQHGDFQHPWSVRDVIQYSSDIFYMLSKFKKENIYKAFYQHLICLFHVSNNWEILVNWKWTPQFHTDHRKMWACLNQTSHYQNIWTISDKKKSPILWSIWTENEQMNAVHYIVVKFVY